MEWSIQQVCTNRSRAWPQFAWILKSMIKCQQWLFSFEGTSFKKYWTRWHERVILGQSYWSVTMTVRFHLFPFRTQKLSSLVPKIVRWKRRVKIGSRRLTWNPWGRNSLGVCFFVRYFLSLAKKLPKVSIFAWFSRVLCYDDSGDAGWPIPFYNDVLSSDLGSAYSTLDRRKEIRKD